MERALVKINKAVAAGMVPLSEDILDFTESTTGANRVREFVRGFSTRKEFTYGRYDFAQGHSFCMD